jgi:hypothetical protein
MENRNGIAVNGCVTQATGRAQPQAAMAMVAAIPGWHRITLGADKGYDRKEFVAALRDHRVTPHLACDATTIIDERTTRHPGDLISQQKRKRIEEIFGWLKTVAGLRKTRHRGAAAGWLDVSFRTGRLQLGQDAQLAAGSRQPHEMARD